MRGVEGRDQTVDRGAAAAARGGLFPFTQPKKHGSCCHMYQERVSTPRVWAAAADTDAVGMLASAVGTAAPRGTAG